MVCHPYHVLGGMSEEAYAHLVTGKGPTFWEHHQGRMKFPECGVEFIAVSILTHFHIQNDVGRGDGGDLPTPPSREGHTYPVSLPKHLSRIWCLVAGCLGGRQVGPNSGFTLHTAMCGIHL